MRRLSLILIALSSFSVHADTMDNYMNISNNIPQMEMKADQQSQAWARSARNVLIITSESIAETLIQANNTAKKQGSPLFCLPENVNLDGATLNTLIQQTYKEISSQQSDKDKMTVSQVALLGMIKTYPCNSSLLQNKPTAQMQHMNELLTH